MAAPADRNMKEYSGEWVMDKKLSNSTEPILKLQGIGWVTRKAISLATITLYVHAYPDPEDRNILHVDIEQVASGGLKGTTERRTTDWEPREHQDHIFGSCEGRTRMVRGSEGDDKKVRPNVEPQTKIGGNGVDDATVLRFLRGEILQDGSECEGFAVDEGVGDGFGEGDGLWLHSFVVNKDPNGGWSAEQVWGFEIIDGQRYHTRRVVVAKDGEFQMARLVYDFLKHRQE